jgi:urease accessory protein
VAREPGQGRAEKRAGDLRLFVHAAKALDQVFAENRAVGRIALSVAAAHGTSRRQRIYEDGPLRVRFPNGGGALNAVIVNSAGGLAGGDRHELDIAVQDDAALDVTTAAAEKVYRTLGPPAEIALRLSVGAGAQLAWLPQETILFDRARLSRTIDIELAPGASLLVAEAVVFGRTAMGEAVEEGGFQDRWRVRRRGAFLFAEAVRLDGRIGEKLVETAVAGGSIAMATVLAIPGDGALVDRVRAHSFCGEAGASAWNGLAVVRLVAKDGATLRRDLAVAIAAMGGRLPRLWLN